MSTLTLPKLNRAQGHIQLSGSKSLSNRVLLLAALAQGQTRIHNLLDSDDVTHMLNALKILGVPYHMSANKTECLMDGRAGPLAIGQRAQLFLGNAGTAMRPLVAVLCQGVGEFELTGEARMYERPIGHLVDALQQLGGQIHYLGDSGFPPLKIKASRLTGQSVQIAGNLSSQFLTALLMAAPLMDNDLRISVVGELVSKPYIDITLKLMAEFGVQVHHQQHQEFFIPSGQHYQSPKDVWIEGDASSASYFLAAAAIAGGPVRVQGTGLASMQGDARFAEVLAQMGAKVEWSDHWIEVSRQGPLQAIDVDLNAIPDAAMTIATTALFAKGTTTIRNIYNWRVKETDRLSAMATELRKVGAQVEEGQDYIRIDPPEKWQDAIIDTYNDHRMAMCFSLCAFGEARITINDPECTRKTFPDYFERFARITQPIQS